MFEEKTINRVPNKALNQIRSEATTQSTFSMENIPPNVELSTDKVILRPLSLDHLHAFYQAGSLQ